MIKKLLLLLFCLNSLSFCGSSLVLDEFSKGEQLSVKTKVSDTSLFSGNYSRKQQMGFLRNIFNAGKMYSKTIKVPKSNPQKEHLLNAGKFASYGIFGFLGTYLLSDSLKFGISFAGIMMWLNRNSYFQKRDKINLCTEKRLKMQKKIDDIQKELNSIDCQNSLSRGHLKDDYEKVWECCKELKKTKDYLEKMK